MANTGLPTCAARLAWVSLAVAALGLFVACGPTAGDEMLTPRERLDAAAERIGQVSSVDFTLSHDEGETPLLPGVVLQQATGTVDGPERAVVDVEALVSFANAFIEMNIVVNGEDATMTDPLSGTPLPVPSSSLPFNLLGLGGTLAGILTAIEDPAYSGDETLDGVASKGVAGTISGAAIQPLIPGADPGLRQDIEVWVGDDDLPRRVRLAGRLLPNDTEGVIRVLSFRNFDTARIPDAAN